VKRDYCLRQCAIHNTYAALRTVKGKEDAVMTLVQKALKEEQDPRSMDGQEWIIHELAHIVQQRKNKFSRVSGGGLTADTPDDVHEREADRAANKVAGPAAQTGAQGQEKMRTEAAQMSD
jgi:hypothetical protein